ncbi:hypothetical protein GCM10023082_04640 [Streptomyces tremellae]|uniref:Uncharacterized protein n=1 Tax=Streptomyces tremellae TaxID=1124239 RepID=A0ABP7DVU6_9ACTN
MTRTSNSPLGEQRAPRPTLTRVARSETDMPHGSLAPNAARTPAPHNCGTQSLSVPETRSTPPLSCDDGRGTEAGTVEGPAPVPGAAAPASRLQPGQLSAEIDIVWLLPLDALDYVRESLEIIKCRSGKPPVPRTRTPGRLRQLRPEHPRDQGHGAAPCPTLRPPPRRRRARHDPMPPPGPRRGASRRSAGRVGVLPYCGGVLAVSDRPKVQTPTDRAGAGEWE